MAKARTCGMPAGIGSCPTIMRKRNSPRAMSSARRLRNRWPTHSTPASISISAIWHRELVARRFPHIGRVCSRFGLELARDRIPVRPGAHYMIGGLSVNLDGETTVPGLFAAGEVTATGLHGANRLASNSLLEGLVFGLRAGRAASAQASEIPDSFRALPLVSDWAPPDRDLEELDIEDVGNSLNSLMWAQRRHSAGRGRARTGAEAA